MNSPKLYTVYCKNARLSHGIKPFTYLLTYLLTDLLTYLLTDLLIPLLTDIVTQCVRFYHAELRNVCINSRLFAFTAVLVDANSADRVAH